jgi:HK97 family phage major capsid protein
MATESANIQVELGQLQRELDRALKNKSAESKEVATRINDRMDKIEETNQKLVKSVLRQRNFSKDFEEKFNNLEKQLYRNPSNNPDFHHASEQMSAFTTFIKHGPEMLSDEGRKLITEDISFKLNRDSAYATDKNHINKENKYLRTDSNVEGGFLAPPDYSNEILKKITEVSDIRAVARITPTTRESFKIPLRNTLMPAFWEGQAIPAPEGNSQYAMNEIFTKTLTVYTDLTQEMIEDSVFDMEAEVTKDSAERFAQAEGQAFVIGDGSLQPEGILTNPNTQVITSSAVNAFTGDDLINMFGQLKTGYKPTYLLNRVTLAFVRTLKDGVGRYLWEPGLAGAYPSTIDGLPYMSTIDVPNIGAGNKAVILGDFYRGYRIVDRTMMWVVRDPFTQATQRMVRIVFARRVGAQVVLPEAIKVLQCAS